MVLESDLLGEVQDQTEDSRHAQDSSVEVQRSCWIFDPQHRLLHHVVLQRPKSARRGEISM